METKKSFKDFLGESPQAIIDNWSGFKTKLISIGKGGIKDNWDFIDSFEHKGKPVQLFKSKTTHKYILGAWAHEGIKEVFVVITTLKILPRPDLKPFFKNPIQMSEVETSEDFRNMGFSKVLYNWFLYQDYDVISDRTQYNYIRKTYDRLSKNHNIKADLFDDESKQFLKKDIDVDSGEEDWDFDSKLWSINADKSHLLICLRKV